MKTLLVLTFTFTSYLLFSQAETFVPDDNFESYLEANDMGNGVLNDDHVLTANINTVVDLDVSGLGILSLVGIEDFAALETLNCSSNVLLESLDVFNNTALRELRGFNCDLSTLTLPDNNLLNYLSIGNNNLTDLDVSGYPLLTYLSFSNNNGNLGSFDLSPNPQLTFLYCHNSGVSSLDISQNTLLDQVWCFGNSLTSLDISGLSALTVLRCHNNALTTLTVSNNTSLLNLDCGNNQLTSINTMMFPNIETFYCPLNNLSVLDVTGNTNLLELSCWDNNLTSLDTSNNNALEYLECGGNTSLSNLTLPNSRTTLTSLWAYNMNLSALNYSEYTALENLDIGINNFTSADISTLPNLFQFYCNQNQLVSLNISNGQNENLVWMWAHDNPGLICIQVDNVAEAQTHSSPEWIRDIGAEFSTNCALAVAEVAMQQITLTPNPTNGVIIVKSPLAVDYELYNLFGSRILEGSIISGINEISTSSLTAGMYLMKLNNGARSIVKKIIRK